MRIACPQCRVYEGHVDSFGMVCTVQSRKIHSLKLHYDDTVGRYVHVNPPLWGRTKVFYETASNAPQEIVFLHTAGSDSRQYHGVLNDKRMQEKCKM